MTTISSLALTLAPRLAVTQAQASLSTAQVELSSGQMADIGLGLGSGTGNYLSLGSQVQQLKALQGSNSTTSSTLNSTTTSLDTLRSTASTFLSSLLSAATTGGVPSTLITDSSNNLTALTSALNTTVAGQAIFGGLNSANPPMSAYTAGSASKAAVDASFSAAFGTTQTSASASTITGPQMQSYLSGSFANLFSPTGYAATWSTASSQVPTAKISTTETVQTSVSANDVAFRNLAQAYTMVQEFGSSNFGTDAGQAVIAAATALVSQAVTGITTTEAGIGVSQTAVSNANDRMTTQINYLTSQAGDMVSVDPSALSTKITGLQTQIQASYEITTQLQQLSLVNYLK